MGISMDILIKDRCVGLVMFHVASRQPWTNALPYTQAGSGLAGMASGWKVIASIDSEPGENSNCNWGTKKSAIHWALLHPELTLLKWDSNILHPSWTWFGSNMKVNQTEAFKLDHSVAPFTFTLEVKAMVIAIPAVRNQSTEAPANLSALPASGWNQWALHCYTPFGDVDWVAQTPWNTTAINSLTKTTPLVRPFLDGLVLWTTTNYICKILISFGCMSLRLHRSSRTKKMER